MSLDLGNKVDAWQGAWAHLEERLNEVFRTRLSRKSRRRCFELLWLGINLRHKRVITESLA